MGLVEFIIHKTEDISRFYLFLNCWENIRSKKILVRDLKLLINQTNNIIKLLDLKYPVVMD